MTFNKILWTSVIGGGLAFATAAYLGNANLVRRENLQAIRTNEGVAAVYEQGALPETLDRHVKFAGNEGKEIHFSDHNKSGVFGDSKQDKVYLENTVSTDELKSSNPDLYNTINSVYSAVLHKI